MTISLSMCISLKGIIQFTRKKNPTRFTETDVVHKYSKKKTDRIKWLHATKETTEKEITIATGVCVDQL